MKVSSSSTFIFHHHSIICLLPTLPRVGAASNFDWIDSKWCLERPRTDIFTRFVWILAVVSIVLLLSILTSPWGWEVANIHEDLPWCRCILFFCLWHLEVEVKVGDHSPLRDECGSILSCFCRAASTYQVTIWPSLVSKGSEIPIAPLRTNFIEANARFFQFYTSLTMLTQIYHSWIPLFFLILYSLIQMNGNCCIVIISKMGFSQHAFSSVCSLVKLSYENCPSHHKHYFSISYICRKVDHTSQLKGGICD